MEDVDDSSDTVAGRTEEPLRTKRRRELRAHLTRTATALFLEHGFDAVTVARIAAACGVTEKTVFNHFTSKEELLLDRLPGLIAELTRRLVETRGSIVDATVELLDEELMSLTSSARAGHVDLEQVRRFGELVRSTPTLLAHRSEGLRQLTAQVAAALVQGREAAVDDPEIRITAEALGGLVTFFFDSVHRHVGRYRSARSVRTRVRADLHRAAAVLDTGLRHFHAEPS